LGTPRSFWQELRDAGITVLASHPFKWTAPFHYVHRDHRKLIIVDLKIAFTGGLNIANEYRGFHRKLRPESGGRVGGIQAFYSKALSFRPSFTPSGRVGMSGRESG